MNKITLGVIFGTIAGLIDISPMIAMKLPLAANLSAFSLWIVAGFFIATSNLQFNGVIKGLLISFLALMPSAILIGNNGLADLLPVLIMTCLLGSLLGYIMGKYGK